MRAATSAGAADPSLARSVVSLRELRGQTIFVVFKYWFIRDLDKRFHPYANLVALSKSDQPIKSVSRMSVEGANSVNGSHVGGTWYVVVLGQVVKML